MSFVDGSYDPSPILVYTVDVQYFPDVLFTEGNEVILHGSVLWLYCHVDVHALRVIWMKDGSPLFQDIPHIRKRVSFTNNSITNLLMVDTVQTSDSGVYQCIADHERTLKGRRLTLTGTVYGVDTAFYSPSHANSVCSHLWITFYQGHGF